MSVCTLYMHLMYISFCSMFICSLLFCAADQMRGLSHTVREQYVSSVCACDIQTIYKQSWTTVCTGIENADFFLLHFTSHTHTQSKRTNDVMHLIAPMYTMLRVHFFLLFLSVILFCVLHIIFHSDRFTLLTRLHSDIYSFDRDERLSIQMISTYF